MVSAGVWEGIEAGSGVLTSAVLVTGAAVALVVVAVVVAVTDGFIFLSSSLSLVAAEGFGASTEDLVAVWGSVTGAGACGCGVGSVAATSASVGGLFVLSASFVMLSAFAAFE